MIPELGHFAIILALCIALVQGVLPLIGSFKKNFYWMAVSIPAARLQCLMIIISFACLVYLFITQDFSVSYVANNSNLALPVHYRISAVWGAHEGSLLLWVLILSLWTLAVTHFSKGLPLGFVARVLAVLGLISVGFLLFILFTSNPFDRLFPIPLDGHDLNPLLQDPGLIFHPPMLYTGYVGLAVPFAFAIAALLEGRIDAAWTRWTRPWTIVAWLFLTLGIALGSWWAYYELGWGGWWFWDPVENASFMPWLIATALIHSLAVTEQRSAFKAWTVLLSIFGFSLSLLGTFLVRSGVLVSVHAFATDPARGIFILIFLFIVIGSALALYAWRGTSVSSGGTFSLMSRETFLLINNLLLFVACGTILMGTLYPIFLDALNLGKISIGPPYFNLVFAILMIPMVFILAFAPLSRWKKDKFIILIKSILPMLLASFLLGAGLIWFFAPGDKSIPAMLAIGIACWVMLMSMKILYLQVANKQHKLTAIFKLPSRFWGMLLAHFGVGVFIVGVTIVKVYEVEKNVRLEPGQSESIYDYTFVFNGISNIKGPNYSAQRGNITVLKNGKEITMLYPEKRIYLRQGNPMTEAGIDSTLFRDVYVSLGEELEPAKGSAGAWAVRVYFKPFVVWIWLGPLLMAIGGVLAASDRRYRLSKKLKASLSNNFSKVTA